MSAENRNYLLAEALAEELARSGVRHACICPGSRSAPIAMAFARSDRIRTWMHLDERSASFFALGIARSLETPVAVVVSSGTAGANCYPAVIEARYSATPLLIITADRPPELWEWGAPQTMDQHRLYGVHAKWAVNLPLPEVSAAHLRFLRMTANRAAVTASIPPAGPVHINLPLREPLAPERAPQELSLVDSDEAWQGRNDDRPFAAATAGARAPDPGVIRRLAPTLLSQERGLIVCGWQRSHTFPSLVVDLAKRLGFPVLADPLSQVRTGLDEHDLVVDAYDLFLRDPDLVRRLEPEVVLRFGGLPTSRSLTQYLEGHRAADHILVNDGQWPDPGHVATEVVVADPVATCRALLGALDGTVRGETVWTRRWTALRQQAHQAILREVAGMTELFEGKIFLELAKLAPEASVLFAGNSMPVRDMDAFLPRSAQPLHCVANRGVNGIDGVVSTALGYAASGRQVVLVVGDISFYHDINGLLAARRSALPCTIVVVNNDGGGIFSFLPQARFQEHYEELFGTPHGLGFEPIARLYGLDYARTDDWDGFRSAVRSGLQSNGTTIIEIPGERNRNVELHRRVEGAVRTAVQRKVEASPCHSCP